jgi:hypothetical protein
MLAPNDVEALTVQKKWVDAGVDYALRSWAVTFNRLGKKNIYSRLSKIVVGVVAEHATRAALEKYKIDFDSTGATEWYAVDRYDMGVNGKSIDIKAIFLDRDNNSQMKKLNKAGVLADLQTGILRFTALVPEDQFNSAAAKRRAGREKIYVFPIVDANSEVSSSAGRLCHLMWDYRWLKKGDKKDSAHLGRLEVSSKTGGKVRLIGTSEKNKLVVEDVQAGTSTRQSKNEFWQLFSIELLGHKPIDLTVKSPHCRVTEKIHARLGFAIKPSADKPAQNDWSPVGIANGSVYVAGFATDNYLRLNGKPYPRYSKDVLQYSDTLISNWGISVQKLTPWTDLGNL